MTVQRTDFSLFTVDSNEFQPFTTLGCESLLHGMPCRFVTTDHAKRSTKKIAAKSAMPQSKTPACRQRRRSACRGGTCDWQSIASQAERQRLEYLERQAIEEAVPSVFRHPASVILSIRLKDSVVKRSFSGTVT